mmetsp:Transcript_34219/g.63081  ORF Transcript_34219/g.63081 Transcript_34219/m.63081 type:complete len:589 (+) Transcript_34219:73-1839(+)
MVIYHLPTRPIPNHSPRHAHKTSRRQRRHISFTGILVPCAFIAVAALSLFGVLIGTRYASLPTSYRSSNTAKDAMSIRIDSRPDSYVDQLVGNTHDDDDEIHMRHKKIIVDSSNEAESPSSHFQSREEQFSDKDTSNDSESPPSHFQSKDEQVSDESMSDDAETPPSNFQSNDEHLTEDQNGGEISSLKSMFNAERFFFNKKNDEANKMPSNSLRHRKSHFPRIMSIDGGRDFNFKIRGQRKDDEREIYVSSEGLRQQKRLLDSEDFRYRDPLYEGDCVPMQKWQETSFPNCNLFHELDFLGKLRTEEFEYYAKGGYNQIFWLNEDDKEDDPELVMKILKYGTLYTDRNYDRVRRDGLILERLTPSPYVLDTYGFCGFDVLTPYADGGTFGQRMSSWRRGKLKLSPKTRLKYAMEVASGLADVHDIDGEGMSSVAHGDLKGGQYLFLDGVIKLGDFNRGRFLRRNSTAPDTACPYTIGKNDAAFRSPEEYEYLPQTSAIDVWALGSILYEILTGKDVWHDTDTKKAQKNIREGKLPKIPDKYLNSEHPVDVALREAIGMCYIFDPKERAKAADVASYLRKKLSELTEE